MGVRLGTPSEIRRKYPRVRPENLKSLLAHSFQEAVVVHPPLSALLAQDGNSTSRHQGKLEYFPLLIANVALLAGHASFLRHNRHTPTSCNVVMAQARNLAIMPLELDACFFGLRGLQRLGPCLV